MWSPQISVRLLSAPRRRITAGDAQWQPWVPAQRQGRSLPPASLPSILIPARAATALELRPLRHDRQRPRAKSSPSSKCSSSRSQRQQAASARGAGTASSGIIRFDQGIAAGSGQRGGGTHQRCAAGTLAPKGAGFRELQQPSNEHRRNPAPSEGTSVYPTRIEELPSLQSKGTSALIKRALRTPIKGNFYTCQRSVERTQAPIKRNCGLLNEDYRISLSPTKGKELQHPSNKHSRANQRELLHLSKKRRRNPSKGTSAYQTGTKETPTL
ncbi:hypothetical protein NDU88_006082 [Pleurodeles waltl]|uniref:Uncharacterized protein n=1 Tax=Pleurodeles waltl TaxID=8319 RepID=A0AAV7SNM1_PLEWA|nr:hypothetical protein NDU88_006082 [Pleurodeles waltl]